MLNTVMLTKVSIGIYIPLYRRLALLAGDFSYEFRHEVAGQFGADFCNQFAGFVIAHFKVGNSVRMVQLVQVVQQIYS